MKTKFFIGLLFALLTLSGITVFADSDGTYVYSVSNNVATITEVADKTAFSGSQTIPETIGGYPVQAISASTFKDCASLTAIGCVALKKAIVSDDTDYIEDYAFYGCDACVLYCVDNDYVAEYAGFNFLQYYRL